MDNNYLLKKWLNNDLTETERSAFEQLEDARLNEAIIENAQHFKASHFSKPERYEVFEQQLVHKETPVRSLSWKRSLLKIASVLVIGFALYYSFFYDALTTVQTLAAEKTAIVLPDNSTVMLNAVSEITYNEKDWAEERALTLHGEAFFKVAKGKKFEVQTTKGIVTVLGTQFNVNQRDNYFEVVCYEGIVQVSVGSTVKKLYAGDTFRRDGDVLSSNTTNTVTPRWTENMSTFEKIAFSSVLEEIERQFDIEIEYNGTQKQQLFSGGFTHDNLESALQSVTAPLGINYKMNGKTKVMLFD